MPIEREGHAPGAPSRFPQFEYAGFHGCASFCALELVPLGDGRTLVIAIERADNPGTSVTNASELLASFVCDRFGIDPAKLVWVEHYGYASPTFPERGYDRVEFQRFHPDRAMGLPAITPACSTDSTVYFSEPQWLPMTSEEWEALGVPPRPPVRYESRTF